MKARMMMAMSASMVWLTASALGQLQIGDMAPKLSVSDWVKGEPVALASGLGQNFYVIEFWATWCPPCIESIPHMSELQRKYRKDGLMVVGMAGPGRGESLGTVKRFVRKRGESITYRIGFDKTGATHDRYMAASGQGGIPFAFVVDRAGKLVWRGHPGDPQMDAVISQVASGAFDLATARLQETLLPVFGRLHRYAALGDWVTFKATVKQILAMDPANVDAFNAMVYAYLIETDDEEGLRALVNAHIEAHRADVVAMRRLAAALLEIGPIDRRQPELAVKAAAAAFELQKVKDAELIGTYARAMFEIGMVERAIELQERALVASNGGDERESVEKILKFYKRCKALQSKNL